MFFSDEPGGQLHKASTTDIDTRIRECATKLNDSGLLAKLAYIRHACTRYTVSSKMLSRPL